MKFKKLLFISTISLLALSACELRKIEPKVPSWTTTIEIPLIKKTVMLSEALADQDLNGQATDENGNPLSDDALLYVFTADTIDIDTISVGEYLSIDAMAMDMSQTIDDVSIQGSTMNENVTFSDIGVDPIQKHISTLMGPIELDSIPPSNTDPITLRELFTSVETVPDDTPFEIPAFDIEPIVRHFNFDDFESATFTSGGFDISINNDMVMTLGSPVTIILQDTFGVDIPGTTLVWNEIILPGMSSSKTMELAGKTLPGNILVKITGHSEGTQGGTVVMSEDVRNSSFTIGIGANDLVVSTADAKVPSQIVEENGSILLDDSANKIEEAGIKEGSLDININNAMSVASELTITITSLLDPDDVAFTQVIPLLPNDLAFSHNDIANYTMVMDINTQEVLYSYTVVTEDTDPNYITLSETDSVVVTIDLFGLNTEDQIKFSNISGIIESQNMYFSGTIDAGSDSELLEASISTGSVNVVVQNDINLTGSGASDLTLIISELFDGNGDTLRILPTQLGPGETVIPIQLDGFTLRMPRQNQTLNYRADVTTQGDEQGSYNLLGDIQVDIEVSEMTFSSITGYFTQEAMVDSSEIDLESDHELHSAVFSSGEIELTIKNKIGALATTDFIINEFYQNGSPLSESILIQNTTDDQITTIPLTGVTLLLDGNNQMIHTQSVISIPSDEEMTLVFGDSILVDVVIRDLAFEEIRGIISPIEVDMDSLENDIPAFPDMLEGLKFAKVNIAINFDMGIEIPVFLDLTLVSYNDIGDTMRSSVSNWNIGDSAIVHIPNAASLINIYPTKILAFGTTRVGDGASEGLIRSDQFVSGSLTVEAPLVFLMNEPVEMSMDVAKVSMSDSEIPPEMQSLTLFLRGVNDFSFGADVVLLLSNDSTQLVEHPELGDTLAVLELTPGPFDTSVLLDEADLTYLRTEPFIIPQIFMKGIPDGSGGFIPSRFTNVDSLSLSASAILEVLVEGDSK